MKYIIESCGLHQRRVQSRRQLQIPTCPISADYCSFIIESPEPHSTKVFVEGNKLGWCQSWFLCWGLVCYVNLGNSRFMALGNPRQSCFLIMQLKPELFSNQVTHLTQTKLVARKVCKAEKKREKHPLSLSSCCQTTINSLLPPSGNSGLIIYIIILPT